MVRRYSQRPGGYTRVLKTGRDPRDASPLALLEYVDAPGDTAVALGHRQLPSIGKAIKETQKAIESLSFPPKDPSVHSFAGRFSARTKDKLSRRMKALNRVHSKLSNIVQRNVLPEGHKEVKFPSRNMEIRVRKKVWTRPLPPKKGKEDTPRSVVMVRRKLEIVPRVVVPPKEKRLSSVNQIRFKPRQVKWKNAHLRV
jgi:hypothetical protein